MAREAGAKKVYLASAAPPVRHANVYGIDMPTREELIGADRSEEEISALIGADGFLRCFPHLHDSDGFFAARLERHP